MVQTDPLALELQPGDVWRFAAPEVAGEYPLEFALVFRRVHDEGAKHPSAQVALDQVAEVPVVGGPSDEFHVLANWPQRRLTEPLPVAFNVLNLEMGPCFNDVIAVLIKMSNYVHLPSFQTQLRKPVTSLGCALVASGAAAGISQGPPFPTFVCFGL